MLEKKLKSNANVLIGFAFLSSSLTFTRLGTRAVRVENADSTFILEISITNKFTRENTFFFRSAQECVDEYNEAMEAKNAEAREDTIRIVVASILSGTVILAAIILYLTIGRL